MSIKCAVVARIDPVRLTYAILGIAYALMWDTSPAHAQSLGAPLERTVPPLLASNSDVTSSATDIGEVTVTARRRTENAQDVPIPITVLTGAGLDNVGVIRLEDLNQHLPSTNVQFINPLQTSVAVRGLGTGPANDGLTSSVGVYLDNVYLGRSGMANQDLIDIDQLTMLRGPQGTLFGKNTTAGVLNLSTLQPGFTPTGIAEASYGFQAGGGPYYQIRAAYGGPLTDTIAGRLTVSNTYRDGFVTNITDGRKLDGSDRSGFRGQLRFQPTDDFSLRAIADYDRENSRCCQGILYSPGPNNGALFYGHVAALGGIAVFDPNYRTTSIDGPQSMQVHQGGGSVEANWKLGDYKLTSISAYRSWWFLPTNDPDFTSIPAIHNAGQQVDDDQWSQELRLASPDGRVVEWVSGLYYFYQYQDDVQFTQYGPDAGAYLLSPILTNGITDLHTYYKKNSYAAFGQATWHATEQLSVTAGLRETNETNSAAVWRDGSGSPGFVAAFGPRSQAPLSTTDNDLSALFTVDYKISQALLAYASVSRGEQAGGINAVFPSGTLTTQSLIIAPEKATDYELGLKSSWFDTRLILNANVFWTQVKDYQATQIQTPSPGVSVQTLSNVGLVRTRGVELEISAIPIEGLTLAVTSSYDNATYLSYHDAPCSAEATAAGLKICDLTGRPVVGAPHWTVNPNVTYSRTLPRGLTGYFGTDYSWRSSFYGTTDDSELAKVRAYGLVNLRAGVSGDIGAKRWDASLWSTNTLDRHYVVGGTGVSTYLTYYEWPGDPRTVGATFKVSF